MEKNALPELTRRNLSEEVYDVLKRGILTNVFAPGERLRLDEIEEQLGVSRTPLKVALDRLAAEGLVEVMPRRGTFVTENTPEDTAEAFEVRRILEIYASELVAKTVDGEGLGVLRDVHRQLEERAGEGACEDDDALIECIDLDHRFHALIMDLGGNSRLKEAWEQVNVHVQMARMRSPNAGDLLRVAVEEHSQLLGAFETGDENAARTLMDAHLRHAKRVMLEEINRQG